MMSHARRVALGGGEVSIFDWINPPTHCDLRALDCDSASKLHQWREAVSSLFRVSSMDKPQTSELTCYSLERLQVGRITAQGQRIGHLAGVDQLDATGNALVLLVLEGRLQIRVNGVEAEALPGDLCLIDALGEYEATLSACDLLFVAIPQELLEFSPRDSEIFHGSVLPGTAPSALLLGHYMRELLAACPRIGGAEPARVSAALVSLVLATYQGFVPVHAAVDDATDHVFLNEPLRRYVEAHLAFPDLTAQNICNAFGMSRASLYRLFEPVGGVAKYIRDQRVRRAAADIANPEFRRMRIASITKRWGFKSESSFAKALKREHGLSPRDLRRQADGSAPNGLSADGSGLPSKKSHEPQGGGT